MPRGDSLDARRLTALSDGVFAIAMTLLVLDVKDAAVAGGAVGPQLASYGLSFMILGLLWNGHAVAFHYVERSDRVLLWLNVAFLLFAALIPLPAEMIAEWPVRFEAVAVYGAVLSCSALALLALWTYATHHSVRLVRSNLAAGTVRGLKVRLVRATALYLFGVAIAWWSPAVGVVVLALSHAFFIARPVDAVEAP